jgi:hypothetical protein
VDDTIEVSYYLVILKRQDAATWVVLAEGKDFGLLRNTGLWETVDASDP